MHRAGKALAHRQWRNQQFIDSKRAEAPGRPHDIDDRIDRADFVKVDRFGRGVVDLGFRHGERIEDCNGPMLHLGRQRALLDAGLDIAEMALRLRRGDLDVELRRRNTAELAPSQTQFVSAQFKRRHGQLELWEVDPKVEQGADQHVAAQSRKSIEIGANHGFT